MYHGKGTLTLGNGDKFTGEFKKNFNQLNEGINVLEFGPGYGDLAIELSRAFKIKNYYFIDHSQENLDHIQNVLKLKNASYFSNSTRSGSLMA